ncbi:MAG TPA: type II toxin-antitoxin system RelE/ParE family toxin [Terracidiphilus sp.]|jgi:plasmid stabilization system protein ParE|nr:type II toxin-antitoxin system RelE/ParE family toxin [Terracidiphilus sp.]
MAYLVKITPRARRDLELLFDDIHAGDSESAWKWYKGLKEAVFTLEELPRRCPATRENPQLRHLLYGRKPHVYRVIFRILEKQKRVNVLHIRHGVRRKFTAFDFR